MTEQPATTGTGTGQSVSPAATAAPSQSPQPAAPDRTRGHSPSRALREKRQAQQQQQPSNGQGEQERGEQAQGGVPQMLRIGDVEYSADEVNSAIAHRIEAEARKAALPKTPNDYAAKLPADFRAPEGVRFEFDMNDPALAAARNVALKRGVDQETFSDMLGVYAATKIGEQQRMGALIAANREKLGSAADARIGQIETWLNARVGGKAKPMIAALRAYPVVETVEALEGLIHQFSTQGGADYSQSHRHEQENTGGKIPGYEGMSFVQRRAAQDAAAGKPVHGPRASGGR